MRRASWATIIGVPIGLTALIFAYLALQGSGDSGAKEVSPLPQLERIDLIAHNGPLPHHASLEVMVHNGGLGRSVVSRAKIEILHVSTLPYCFTQGDLPVTERYGAQLPIDAAPGTAVEVPVHEQLAADRADRFEIALGVVGDNPNVDDELPGLYLFEVDVSLIHDGSRKPLPMGRALVSLPGLPFASVYFLTEGEFEELDSVYNPHDSPVREAWRGTMSCWRTNAKALARAQGTSATYSPQLGEILSSALVPSFSEVEP